MDNLHQIYNNLCVILSELQFFRQAIEYGESSIKFCEEIISNQINNVKNSKLKDEFDHKKKYESLVFRAKCQYNLGMLYKKVNRLKDAQTIFNQAIQQLEENLMFSQKIYKILVEQIKTFKDKEKQLNSGGKSHKVIRTFMMKNDAENLEAYHSTQSQVQDDSAAVHSVSNSQKFPKEHISRPKSAVGEKTYASTKVNTPQNSQLQLRQTIPFKNRKMLSQQNSTKHIPNFTISNTKDMEFLLNMKSKIDSEYLHLNKNEDNSDDERQQNNQIKMMKSAYQKKQLSTYQFQEIPQKINNFIMENNNKLKKRFSSEKMAPVLQLPQETSSLPQQQQQQQQQYQQIFQGDPLSSTSQQVIQNISEKFNSNAESLNVSEQKANEQVVKSQIHQPQQVQPQQMESQQQIRSFEGQNNKEQRKRPSTANFQQTKGQNEQQLQLMRINYEMVSLIEKQSRDQLQIAEEKKKFKVFYYYNKGNNSLKVVIKQVFNGSQEEEEDSEGVLEKQFGINNIMKQLDIRTGNNLEVEEYILQVINRMTNNLGIYVRIVFSFLFFSFPLLLIPLIVRIKFIYKNKIQYYMDKNKNQIRKEKKNLSL